MIKPLYQIMNKPIRSRQGFTLLEILIVVSIIALLSSLGLLNYQEFTNRAKRTAVLAELREYASQLGVARGDTGIFWKLQDLQSSVMPNSDIYNRPVNQPVNGSIYVDTTLWKGPYLSLQKTLTPTDQKSRFDSNGYPLDLYGTRLFVGLLRINGAVTTLMDETQYTPADKPDAVIVMSWGLNRQPGAKTTDPSIYSQKSSRFWIYFNEAGSDDIYYNL